MTAEELRSHIVGCLPCDHAQVQGDDGQHFEAVTPEPPSMNMHDTIHQQVNAHAVVLYMKGSPQFPQCGFSGSAVKVLKACGVRDLTAIDVLADPDIRAGIKAYSNWPTIPQLYVKGELVGGADIVRELFQTGALQTLLDGAIER